MVTPFDTFQIYDPDYSYADLIAESERLIFRQRMIHKFLAGELEPDIVLDMLAQHGIDAADYALNIGDWGGFS